MAAFIIYAIRWAVTLTLFYSALQASAPARNVPPPEPCRAVSHSCGESATSALAFAY